MWTCCCSQPRSSEAASFDAGAALGALAKESGVDPGVLEKLSYSDPKEIHSYLKQSASGPEHADAMTERLLEIRSRRDEPADDDAVEALIGEANVRSKVEPETDSITETQLGRFLELASVASRRRAPDEGTTGDAPS